MVYLPARRPGWAMLLAAAGFVLLVVAGANAYTASATLARMDQSEAGQAAQAAQTVSRYMPGVLATVIRGISSSADPRNSTLYVDAKRSLWQWLALAVAGAVLLVFGLLQRESTLSRGRRPYRETLLVRLGVLAALVAALYGVSLLVSGESPQPVVQLGSAEQVVEPAQVELSAPPPAQQQPQGVTKPPVFRSDSFTVGPLASQTKRVPVLLQSGQVLVGELTVESRDINFRILAPGGQVLAGQRVSGTYPFRFVAGPAGTYLLEFDNSYSVVRSKSVTVRFTIQ